MLDLRSQTAREAYEGIRVLFLGACTVLFYEVFRAADAPWAVLAGNLALGAVFWTVLLVVHELGHAVVGALTGTVLRFDVGNGRALVDTTIRGVRVVIRPFPLEGRVHAIVRGRRLWRARRAAVYVAGVTAEWLVVGVALLLLSDEMLTRPSSSELAPFTMLLFTTIVGTGFNLLPGIVDRDGLEMITDGLGVLEALTMSAEEAESLRRMAEPGEFVGALLAGDAEEAARMLDLAAVSDPELIDALRDLLPLARRERPPQVDRVFRDEANRELFEGLRGGLAAALALQTQRAGGPLDELLEWWQGFAPDEPLLILLRARQSARHGEARAGVEALTTLLASADLPRDFAPLVSIERAWLAIAAERVDLLADLEEELAPWVDGPNATLVRPIVGALQVARGRPDGAVPLLDTPYAGELPQDGARRIAMVARALAQQGRGAAADQAREAARQLDPGCPWLD